MASVVINDTHLTEIANAIREKGGTTELLTLDEMPIAIGAIETGGGGGEDIEPIVLTGTCNYACAGMVAGEFIKHYGDKVSTKDITEADSMFYNSSVERIPFALNFDSTKEASLLKLFGGCEQLKEIPAINNAYPDNIKELFMNCERLRYLPEDLGATWNWDRLHTYNYAYLNGIFDSCYSLRKVPEYFLSNLWGIQTSASYSPYKSIFSGCYALDEINNIPVHQSKLTSNFFSIVVYGCSRLKNFTFATNEDGSPKIASWKSQTIEMDDNVGWVKYSSNIESYNSGIAKGKQVKDDATYAALKDDEDWYTMDVAYSRYNHDSAVATINSLPDTSAYLASTGGTNTIKFKGEAGSKTDGGAINTLTESEIAVATAKGWTVSLV